MITKKTIQTIIKEEVYRKKAWDYIDSKLKLMEQTAPATVDAQNPPANPDLADIRGFIVAWKEKEDEITKLYGLIQPTLDLLSEKEAGKAALANAIKNMMKETGRKNVKIVGAEAKILQMDGAIQHNVKPAALLKEAMTFLNDEATKHIEKLKAAMKYVEIVKTEEFKIESLTEGFFKDLFGKVKSFIAKIVETIKGVATSFKDYSKAQDKFLAQTEKALKML